MGTVKSVRLEFPATLLAIGMTLAATPALSQGAMGPGGAGAPMAPQPRVAPAAPQAPVIAPQVPVIAPQLPTVMPGAAPAPTGTTAGGTPGAAGIKDRPPVEHQEVSTTRLGGSQGGAGGPVLAPAGLRGGFIIPMIALFAPGGASVGPGTTDTTTGQLTFQNLPAGRYTARLQGKDLPAGATGPVTFVATVNGKETARMIFDVPAGGASTHSFDLPFDVGQPPAGIKGTGNIIAILAVR